MNIGAHNAGFITYIAILTMSFLLLLAFMGLRIGQIWESNVVDELQLEDQLGVEWSWIPARRVEECCGTFVCLWPECHGWWGCWV